MYVFFRWLLSISADVIINKHTRSLKDHKLHFFYLLIASLANKRWEQRRWWWGRGGGGAGRRDRVYTIAALIDAFLCIVNIICRLFLEQSSSFVARFIHLDLILFRTDSHVLIIEQTSSLDQTLDSWEIERGVFVLLPLQLLKSANIHPTMHRLLNEVCFRLRFCEAI